MPASSDSKAAKRSPDKLSLLRDHLLFRDLPPPIIDRIGSYMKIRKISRGTTIFNKGDPGSGLFGILNGSVKISVASADGRDVVLNILQTGEIFGEIALLDGRPRTADAIAMSDCELMVIERRDFIQFLRSQPDMTLKFIEILCARLRHTSEQVEDLTFLNLPSRLAKALLQLTSHVESSAPERKIVITQHEISQIIGRSRESTNKQLRVWAKRGWITLDRGGLTVLAPEQLMGIAKAGLELDAS